MSSRRESGITGILAVAVFLMSVAVVRREFFPNLFRHIPPPPPPTFEERWRELLPMGHTLGSPTAKIQIVEFVDFECPYCQAMHSVLRKLRKSYAPDLALTLVHFPISFHKYSRIAARAVECANNQGRLEAYTDAVFNAQDSISRVSWTDLALTSGVLDTLGFNKCMQSSIEPPAIEQGLATGKKFDVGATPTLIVNGWRYSHNPSEQLVRQLIKDLLAGRNPQGTRPQDPATRYGSTKERSKSVVGELTSAPMVELGESGIPAALPPSNQVEFDLSDLTSLIELSDGRLLTFSRHQSRLLRFGKDGRPEKVVAGQGEAPGQFRRALDLIDMGGDSVLFLDIANMRMSTLKARTGEYHSFPLPGSFPQNVSRTMGILPGGTAIISSFGILQAGVLGAITRPEAALYRVGEDGSAVEFLRVPDLETTALKNVIRGHSEISRTQVQLGAHASAVVWGDRIAVASRPTFEIDLYDTLGNRLGGIGATVVRREVTKAMRDSVLGRARGALGAITERPADRGALEREAEATPITDSLPAIDRLLVGKDGMLWTFPPVAPGDSAWTAFAFDTLGHVVARIVSTISGTVMVVAKDHLVMLQKDEDGVVSVWRYPIRQTGAQ